MQAVQSELSPMVMDLAPPGMPANQQVTTKTLFTFLSHTIGAAVPYFELSLFRCHFYQLEVTWVGERRSAGV